MEHLEPSFISLPYASECSKMAEALLTAQDSFSCPVCLDLLKDPVAIPCGHNFCLGCIQDCWDREDGVYSCPQCRHTFTPRPVLNKNSLIAEMVEKVKMMKLQAASPADSPAAPLAASPAGSGDVECDVCTGTKHRAVKSCLVCLASYCEAHIQPHYESTAFKKHKLVEASMNLQEKICSLHDKLLEIFCRTDQQFICYLCVMDEHSGHKTVSAAAERSEKQNQLGQSRETCKQQIQQKEKDVQVLTEVMKNLRSSAQAAVEDTEKIFTELIQSIERRRSEVKELIRAQEKTELSKTEELLKKLEQEIADLRRRDAELEQVSHIEDPIHFLQSFQSLPAVPPVTDLSRINTDPRFSIELVKKLVSEMEQLNGFSKLEINDVSKGFCKLTLNPSKSNGHLQVYAGNKQVNLTAQQHYHSRLRGYTIYPENWCQVLCTEKLSGRCYWEVQISGNVSIAVAYDDVQWQTDQTSSEFGSNNRSWSLECVDSSLYFRAGSQDGRSFNVPECPSKIGVYVDHSAGILSFYNVSDTMTLLHRVNTAFTEPLYAGFGMSTNSSNQLGQNRKTCMQQIQQKERNVQVLKQVMGNLRSSAQAAVEDSEKMFTRLIQSIERRRSEVKELIRAQEKTELSKVEELLKKLEQEIADLRRRDTELEQVSQIEDPIHFLQSFQSLPAVPPVTDISSINTKPQFSVEMVRKLVSEMQQLNELSKLDISEVSKEGVMSPDLPCSRVMGASCLPYASECSKMAEALLTTQDSFSCPVCLDLLKDPVAIPCGHSFCLGCIKDCWDRDDQTGVYSCPQCRHTFTPRPVLNKNSLIAEMVEKVKMLKLQAAPASPGDSPAAPPLAASPAGPGDVECDVCTGTKHRAVKSCLVCLASYCEAHIQTHYESPAFKKHKLVEASMNLQEKICSLHDKLLEIFCRTDQQFICYLCVMDEHSGHKTVSAAAERSEKQNELGQNRKRQKQQIQQKEKDVQVLIEIMGNLRSSAQAAVEDSEKIFTELIQSIERRRSEVKELIRAQEKTELSKLEELLKELEQEIADLRRRDAELEQVSQIEDPIHFLQSLQSLPAPPAVTDVSKINTSPQFSIEFVRKFVSDMKQHNAFSKLEIVETSKVYTVQAAEPKTREEFLKFTWESLDEFAHLTSPHLTSPHLTSPHLTSPQLTYPHLLSFLLLSQMLSDGSSSISECCRMAEALLTAQDSFSCPVCLDLLKDPVTIPCGHSFCLGCIQDCWDQDDQKGVYSCPQCRQAFTPRPVLNKNIILGNLAEDLRKTRLQAAPPAAPPAGSPAAPPVDSPAGSGDVECDVCTGTKHKAVKSCLVCLLSFCEAHIQPHFESPAYKKHKLVDASVNLQEKICSQHDKLLEIFCRTDQTFLCYLCTMDEHRSHDTVSATAERTEKQSSAQAAVEDSEKIFTELIQSMGRRCSGVKELIRAQEKTELSLAEELLKKLEQEIVDLRRGEAELKQLSHTDDHIHFLQPYPSVCHPSQSACSKMAEALLKTQDSFSCPVCLDLLKDPVTIPCGHSYCLGCIQDCLDQDDPTGVYSCPQCRHTFTPRPVLSKNTMLAELAEDLRKTRLQAAPPAGSPAGSGDVECDVCTGTKHRAVKSCLVCLASYCEAHIQTHYEAPAFKKHKLVEASVNLQEMICSLHDKLLEVFCRRDQKCICLLCALDEHRGHDIVSAAAVKPEKQKQLEQNQNHCKQQIQQKEGDVQVLMKVMKDIRSSAEAAVEDSEKIFTELIQSLERRRSELKELIRAREKTELSKTEELLKELEQEIADLRRREAELEQVSQIEEPIHFLQSFQSLPAHTGYTNIYSINTKPQFSIAFVKKFVSEMQQLNGFNKLIIKEISQGFRELTLNPYMSHGSLCLSSGNKQVNLN
ncbi:hypothetical protein NFI96_010098 [Prochilodus magdalenae]|nr:hypothetical protein NFI96_010098 [Prochilodus magdalenae]